MTIVLTAAASIIPSILLLWLFQRADLFPEPPRILWGTFALGVLAIIPAAIAEGVLSVWTAGLPWHPVRALLDAFLVAALVEESLKLLVLKRYSFRKISFNEPMDGIQYGVASALGFATLENILYIAEGGLGVAVMRGLLSVPGHASWGALLGFYAGKGSLEGRPVRGSLAGLTAAVLLHGLYDFPIMLAFQGDKPSSDPVMQAVMILVILAVSITGWVIVVRLVRRTRRIQEQAGESALLGREPAGESALSGREPAGESARVSTRTLYSGSMRPGGVVPAILTAVGALLGIGGGLMTMGIVLGFLTTRVDDPASTAIGGVIVGLLPLVAGMMMFRAGVRRLGRHSA
jgi:RsiW-degrading membrane proteinase PrsW (M82 family)